ncbi:MAG: metal-dependent transcriptional regulator [Planctomycetota bacterium]
MANLSRGLVIPTTVDRSQAREDYLKALYHLGRGGRAVPTSELAEALGVRKPSVSGMLKRLSGEGLVAHQPRHGARLSPAGRVVTMQVVRRHRLLETFLVEILGLDWSEVHEDAEVLEHHLSDRLVAAIDHALGYPPEDPHGHPIPDADGKLPPRDLIPLAALREGEGATVRELRLEGERRLRGWEALGFVPGARVQLLEHREMEDVLRFRVGGEEVVTGGEGIDGVFVDKD